MNLLDVDHLSVSFSLYGQMLQAVRGISFQLKQGEALGIVGESGCGKSAAMQAIPRLMPNAKIEGKILFNGENLLQKSEAEMRAIRGKQIGMVFQDPMSSLNPTMKIGAQIEEALHCHKMHVPGRALDLLRQVDMPQAELRLKQYPHQLSGGMRQRALIAMALACEPQLLIADEPTTALDVTVQAQILEILKKRSKSTSLILITHDLGVVSAVCQRMLVLYAGKIVESGPVQQILHHPKHPYTQMLLRALPRMDRPRLEFLQNIEGAPPNLMKPLQGCSFAPRCPYAMPMCIKEPPLIGGVERETIDSIDEVQSSACWKIQ